MTVPEEASDRNNNYSDGNGRSSRPGPDFLYTDPVVPPQLENVGEWEADPLLVSGECAYRSGEFLYQDYVYDDSGADTTADPDPYWPEPSLEGVNAPTGNLVYPDDWDRYGNNAADLLEFRAGLGENGLRYRLTLQTMKEPEIAAVAIGVDTGGGSGTDDWGYGLGSLGELDLDYVVVSWGSGAELVATDGPTESIPSTVDADRNQIDVRTPLEPGDETWRHYAVVGLWDAEEKQFEQIADGPDEDRPGVSGGADPPPVFNVAFRFDEPLEQSSREPTIGDPFRIDDPDPDDPSESYGQYREHAQANALAERDIAEFGADVDFGKLRAGVCEQSVPDSGLRTRLYASRYELGEGVEVEERDYKSQHTSIVHVLLNRIQPYSVYVPEGYQPEGENPLHVVLHGGGGVYTDVGRENYLRQLGEQRDAVVVVPEARGPNLFYDDEGLLDVFEVVGDAVSQYRIDTDRITVSGASMGGFGTLKAASMYPDLFSRAFAYVSDSESSLLDNLRHVPVVLWNGRDDNIAPPSMYNPTADRLRELGYRHEQSEFLGFGHVTFSARDQWGPIKSFFDGEYLGDESKTAQPARVTYRRVPEHELPKFDVVCDGAYWVQNISVADGFDEALVDVTDHASTEPRPEPKQYTDSGRFPGKHVTIGTRWCRRSAPVSSENTLAVELDGVAEVTVHVDETSIDRDQPIVLDVDSSSEATIRLRSEAGVRSREVPVGRSEHVVEY